MWTAITAMMTLAIAISAATLALAFGASMSWKNRRILVQLLLGTAESTIIGITEWCYDIMARVHGAFDVSPPHVWECDRHECPNQGEIVWGYICQHCGEQNMAEMLLKYENGDNSLPAWLHLSYPTPAPD
ncbi:hypothetical protein HJC99_06930 [Candidatus Saccharibacteria bacterium]|nr:hypothetical protein [Candidatus Saccharibacteria bacterium]